MAKSNPKEAYLIRVRQLIKEIYFKMGGRSEELVIIHGFRVFKVKSADRKVTILQSIFDDYFGDKRTEAKERCIKRLKTI